MSFQIPSKAIHTQTDFEGFQKSQTFKDILDFIKDCTESVVGCSIANEFAESEVVVKFVNFMNRLFVLVDEIPPLKQPMRFGNKAFRHWHEQLKVELNSFLTDLLPLDCANASVEIAPYILEMFGNTTRIDYGTGHELNFALVFQILRRIGVIKKSDLKAVVLRGFVAYIRLMRKLQTVYLLEPAGSHGVWGLDDYHCLVFLWGAAQLATPPRVAPSVATLPVPSEQTVSSSEATSDVTTGDVKQIDDTTSYLPHEITPRSVLDMAILKEYSSEYLYLEGILFIRTLKSSAPFSETSPMLHDISNVADWAKVCSGLMRLFQGEVLLKFPVAQHILFGSVIKCTWRPESSPTETAVATNTI